MTRESPQDSFGNALKTARTAAGLSATEVARRLGKTQSYVSQLESGALHPPEDDERIEMIADVISCNPSDLFIAAGRLPPKVAADALESYRRAPRETADYLRETATGSQAPNLRWRNSTKANLLTNEPTSAHSANTVSGQKVKT